MLRRNLSDDTQASLNSAMIWSVLAILFITAVVPASLFATSRIQDLSSDVSYFTPEKEEDFNHETGPRSTASLTRYVYKNSTGDWHFNSDVGIYTTNQTGQDYHEVIISRNNNDDCMDPIQEFEEYIIPVNSTISDAIEKDLKEFSFSAEFPRNTNLSIEIKVGGDSASYMLAEKDIEASTNLTEYSVEIDYSKILEADSTLSGRKEIYMVIGSDDSTTYEEPAIQPADTLKFNIDLIHSTSAMSTFWTVNVVGGLLGGFLMIGAVFSTPWVDLKDLTGRF